MAQTIWDSWNFPVHAGIVVNGWWRMIWFVLGLAPLALAVTGVSTWLVRRKTRQRSERPGRRLSRNFGGRMLDRRPPTSLRRLGTVVRPALRVGDRGVQPDLSAMSTLVVGVLRRHVLPTALAAGGGLDVQACWSGRAALAGLTVAPRPRAGTAGPVPRLPCGGRCVAADLRGDDDRSERASTSHDVRLAVAAAVGCCPVADGRDLAASLATRRCAGRRMPGRAGQTNSRAGRCDPADRARRRLHGAGDRRPGPQRLPGVHRCRLDRTAPGVAVVLSGVAGLSI